MIVVRFFLCFELLSHLVSLIRSTQQIERYSMPINASIKQLSNNLINPINHQKELEMMPKEHEYIDGNDSIVLSIIILSASSSELVRASLNSIVSYTPKNVEIILLSTDHFEYSNFTKEYDTFHLFQTMVLPTSEAVSVQLKQGISLARGKYLMFVQEISVFAEGSISMLVDALKDGADIVQFKIENNDQSQKCQSTRKRSQIVIKRKVKTRSEILDTSYLESMLRRSLWNLIFSTELCRLVFQYIPDSDLRLMTENKVFFIISCYADSLLEIDSLPVYCNRAFLPHRGMENNTQLALFNYTVQSDCTFLRVLECISRTKDDMKHLNHLYDLVYDRTFKSHMEQFISLPEAQSPPAFDLLVQHYPIYTIVEQLRIHYWYYDISIFNKVKGAKCLERAARPILTIGMQFSRFCYGGIERVMSLQIPTFLKMGYKVVLITEEIRPEVEYPLDKSVIRAKIPPTGHYDRAKALYSIATEHKIDIILHNQADGPLFLYDLLITKSLGIPFVLQRHGNTLQDFQELQVYYINNSILYSVVDKLLVLSHVEESYYRIQGVDAQYFPNPLTYTNITDQYSAPEDVVLWVGRLENLRKRYKDALEIMKIVIKARPTSKLILAGSETDRGGGRYVHSFIKKNGLENNVDWIGHVPNLDDFYKQASVVLVTSSTEAFPMAVTEARLYGIPVVTYELPTVEVLRVKKGYISVPQRNIQKAANAILHLLSNKTERLRLAKETYEVMEVFREFDYEKGWQKLFWEMQHPFQDYKMPSTVSSLDILYFIQDMYVRYVELYDRHNGNNISTSNCSGLFRFVWSKLKTWFLNLKRLCF